MVTFVAAATIMQVLLSTLAGTYMPMETYVNLIVMQL